MSFNHCCITERTPRLVSSIEYHLLIKSWTYLLLGSTYLNKITCVKHALPRLGKIRPPRFQSGFNGQADLITLDGVERYTRFLAGRRRFYLNPFKSTCPLNLSKSGVDLNGRIPLNPSIKSTTNPEFDIFIFWNWYLIFDSQSMIWAWAT